MTHRDSHYSDEWLNKPDKNGTVVKEYLENVDNARVKCKWCSKTFNVRNSGFAQVNQHAGTKKHEQIVNLKKNQRSLVSELEPDDNGAATKVIRLSGNDPAPLVWSQADQKANAEILWIIHTTNENQSFYSSKNIQPLFETMFPDSNIAKKIELGANKISYSLTFGLGPYFHENLVLEIKKSDSFYVISFDEATTDAKNKQIDLHVSFWNETIGRVSINFFGSERLGHAESEKIKEVICKKTFGELNDNKLLMIGMDGPNVNKAVFKLVNEELKLSGHKGLVNIGSCNLHKIHNSFGKGLKCVEHWSVESVLTRLYYWFHKYPARKEDLMKIQEELEVNEEQILRYVSNRWLSIVPVISRVIEQFRPVKSYFLEFLEKRGKINDNAGYSELKKLLSEPLLLVRLSYIKYVGELFQHFLILFQSNAPLIHILHCEMCQLLRILLGTIMRPEYLKSLKNEYLYKIQISLSDKDQMKDVFEIDIGVHTKDLLKTMTDDQKYSFRVEARKFIITICTYLIKELPLNNVILQNMFCLKPSEKLNPKSVIAIEAIAKNMPQVIERRQIDEIMNQWKLYAANETLLEAFNKQH